MAPHGKVTPELRERVVTLKLSGMNLSNINREVDRSKSVISRILHNQELSVLYGRPILNYGRQLSLYVPHMLRVNMTRDLAHLQLSYLQGEIRPTCRTSDLLGKRMLICRT